MEEAVIEAATESNDANQVEMDDITSNPDQDISDLPGAADDSEQPEEDL